MLLVSRVCFMWHYKQVFGGVLGCDVDVRCHAFASCGTKRFFWGFWGVMLKFVVDAREDDVVGVTRLLHVALTGFFGVLGFDAEVRCGC